MASKSQLSSIPLSNGSPLHYWESHKRRKSLRSRRLSSNMLISPSPEDGAGDGSWRKVGSADSDDEDLQSSIPIASESKAAGEAVTPYLAKYVPQTYNPVGQKSLFPMDAKPNTKYCNRHRPDVKCRRQADEESMDQLQNVSGRSAAGASLYAHRWQELGILSNSDQQGIAHVWSLFSAAPPKQRNLMLRGILSVCCFPQLSFISSSIRDLIKIDFISLLPTELSYNILCYLDTTSLCKAAQVCRKWRELADDDVVWHRMCEQHIDRKCTKCGWGLPLLERKRLRTEKRQIQLRALGRGLNEWSPDITPVPDSSASSRELSPSVSISAGTKRPAPQASETEEQESKRLCSGQVVEDQLLGKRPWKDVYKARFKVGTNWKHGRCSIRVLRGHQNGVMCLQFNDNILATGSYDCTIKIWDLDIGKDIRTLVGHNQGIRCLQFDDVRLMSGSIDGTIRIWDWRTGQCIRVLNPARGGVICLNFGQKYLCAGTMENVVRVWSTIDQSTFTLRGHTDFVNAVKIDMASRTILSASDDCTVKLWDLDARKCLKTFEGHVGQVQQVLPLPPEFEIDEEDLLNHNQETETDNDNDEYEQGADSVADSSQSQPDQRGSLTPHSRRQPKVLLPPLINTPLFSDQPERPNPPQYMLTGALDSTIRLWHVPTGRCLRTFFGHLEGIWALAADTLRVVSGAEDRMVKVWGPAIRQVRVHIYGP